MVLITTTIMTNGSNHWILHQPDQVRKNDTMARGTRGPISATSDRLPSHPTKDTLIGAHQCGILLVDAG